MPPPRPRSTAGPLIAALVGVAFVFSGELVLELTGVLLVFNGVHVFGARLYWIFA